MKAMIITYEGTGTLFLPIRHVINSHTFGHFDMAWKYANQGCFCKKSILSGVHVNLTGIYDNYCERLLMYVMLLKNVLMSFF